MSRSFKKKAGKAVLFSYGGFPGDEGNKTGEHGLSLKAYKKEYHRKARAKERLLMSAHDEEIPDLPTDGKGSIKFDYW